jgi:hypothetical protein
MQHELSIDMSKLEQLAEEVSKTKQPKTVGLRADVVAVLKPTTRTRRPRKQSNPDAGATPALTLEQAFGAVPTPPHLRGKSLEEIMELAKEEYADRIGRD